MSDDLTFNERALIEEVRRLGIDAELMRSRIGEAQERAAELQRLRCAGGDNQAAKLDRARAALKRFRP